ncbi:hypothetical protein K443DRAFT_9357 [Laccaria amethystina LaAM-08-1]|uniref:Uncharacterized protein n=1 Tax=Laccaria amethystina LaAM-08-1 TaxID=1095629 RepID=A0A0C9WZ78_9AGAR|nr:hypothetical protein K443DRAFT_9357 [Laccaria amethystina LaAM-08-1]
MTSKGKIGSFALDHDGLVLNICQRAHKNPSNESVRRLLLSIGRLINPNAFLEDIDGQPVASFDTSGDSGPGLDICHLGRNRPLPLEDIGTLGESTTSPLIAAVNKTPWPPSSKLRTFVAATLPRGDVLDLFSPITSTFCIFSTTSGKVVFWDVLAEWDPGEN